MDLLLPLDPRADALEVLHSATAIFTAGDVVDSLLDRIGWPACGGRLLDPSAGDGMFLVRALGRLQTPPGAFEEVARVHGVEIHPLAVRYAREAIAELLEGRGWSSADAQLAAEGVVEEGDFLAGVEVGAGTFRTIAGNPPYLRFQGLPDWFKELYSTQVVDYARADLLHAFLDRCVKVLPPDGTIGFVSADRWLFNATAATLRATIGAKVGLVHVARLDASTAFYRPKYRKAGSPPRIHPVEVVLSPAARDTHPITSTPISPDGGATPDSTEGPVLSSIATVRIAPWLGPEDLFVVDSEAAKRFPPGSTVPAVDTDDIDPASNQLLPPRRHAILTVRDTEPAGAVRDHLLRHRHLMPAKCAGKPFWMPPEPITLDLSRPSLLVPRIARRLRVVALPADVLPINHNLQIVQSDGKHSLQAIADYLSSDQAHAWLQRHAPRLENGFLSITTSLLRRMPVPHLDS